MTRHTHAFKGKGSPEAECKTLVDALEHDAPETVVLACDPASPGGAWTKALRGRTLSALHAFVFDTNFQTLARQRENSIGDLAETLDACPALERVFATGALELSPCTHGELRELYALGDPLSESFVESLGKSKLAKLERIALVLASESEAEAHDVASALLDLHAPALHDVTVHLGADPARALATIGQRGAPASWRSLTLVGDLDEDELLETLEEFADTFSKLESLALPLADYLSEDGQSRAKEIAPRVVDSEDAPHGSAVLPAIYAKW